MTPAAGTGDPAGPVRVGSGRPVSVDVAGSGAPARFAGSMHECGLAVLALPDRLADLAAAIPAEWLDFFGTPAKHAYLAHPGEPGGYFPSRPEDAAAGRDRKEYFHLRVGGRYPVEVGPAARDYLTGALRLARTLLGWLQDGLPAAARPAVPLDAMVSGATGSLLRIQHYVPVDRPPAGRLRAAAHQDVNLLTVLPAPSRPGLQVRDPAGRWRDLPLPPRSAVVNGGLLLQAATGGHYPAVEHRVRNPPAGGDRSSRVSLPLFVHPAPDTPIGDGTAAALLRAYVAEQRGHGWRPVPGGR
ncbi:MAG: 2OG-Fe(II) oxygenase family protein [Mycobacteriales bacterium]